MDRSKTHNLIYVAVGLLGGLTAIGCSSTSDTASEDTAIKKAAVENVATTKAAVEKAAGEMIAVSLEGQRVEASCGQCKFGLKGGGCDLAIRHEGVAYYVDGTGINDHGDSHATDGFCNAVRTADVSGRVEDGRFVATSFQLVDAP